MCRQRFLLLATRQSNVAGCCSRVGHAWCHLLGNATYLAECLLAIRTGETGSLHHGTDYLVKLSQVTLKLQPVSTDSHLVSVGAVLKGKLYIPRINGEDKAPTSLPTTATKGSGIFTAAVNLAQQGA